MFLAEGKEFLDVGGSVVFAASGFGRREFWIGVAEKFVEESGNGAAFLGESSVFVEALAAACEMGDECVYEHVAGAGVERKDQRRFCVCRNDGDVGDAADVEGDAAEPFMQVECVVGERDERSAAAAESEVGWAEVGDGGDAGAGGDDRAFADLKRRGRACA